MATKPQQRITAICDAKGVLTRADEPLASLQQACGGEIGGVLMIPALKPLVELARSTGIRMSRAFSASDGETNIQAWADLQPTPGGRTERSVEIAILSWHAESDPDADADRPASVAHPSHTGEITLRLDGDLRVLAHDCDVPDAADFVRNLKSQPLRLLTDVLSSEEVDFTEHTHWRLLDGTTVSIPGSPRVWTLNLDPLGPQASGFVASLTAQSALPEEAYAENQQGGDIPLVSRELTPALRQPVTRIIANAETIRSKLAGPLAQEYADYAADIATAGQHLLALIEDLAEIDDIEDAAFQTVPRRIDLADVARRAAGILGGRAREKSIGIVPPQDGESLPAFAEYRRALQIVLNLLGNAVRYSPEESQIWLRCDTFGDFATLTVADQGHGLTEEEQLRAFDKFERLGREDKGGSGLGLHISRELARAMNGDITVESAKGQGARFTLRLPALT